MLEPEFFIEIFRALPSPGLLVKFNNHIFMIVAVNDAFLLDNHLKIEQLLNNSFPEIFSLHHPQGNQGWQTLLEEVKEFKKPVHFTIAGLLNVKQFVVTTKVKPQQLTFTPVLNAQQEVECVICTLKAQDHLASDNKQEQRSAEKLDIQRKFLEETHRMAKVGTWDIDLVNHVFTWSDVLKEIHETDADFEPDWERVSKLYSLHHQEEMLSFMNRITLDNGNLFDMELQFTSFKGNNRWIRTIGKVEFDPVDNKYVRMYGVSIDITENRQASFSLIAAHQPIQSLLKTLGIVVWETNLQSNKMNFISDHVKKMCGYPTQDWLTKPGFKEDHLHPKDKNRVLRLMTRGIQKGINFSFDYRMINAGNNIVWLQDIISVVMKDEQPQLLRGFTVDITRAKRLYELELLEKQVLELNGKRESTVQEVLTFYLEGMEAIFDRVKINLLQVKNNCLYSLAAPSLPSAYLKAVEGLSVGRSAGTSGAAALLKQRVISKDLKNDPLWEKYKHFLLPERVKACWSYPIMDAENVVMATLGIYHQEVKAPNEAESKVIYRAINFLKLILENRHNLEVLQETNVLLLQCQEMAGFGNWSWNLSSNIMCWSDTLYSIYGLKKGAYKPTFEGYLDLLYHEDKERVSANFGGVLSTKKTVAFEARIQRPDGEIRHLRSFAKLILDENGMSIKLIGAHFDITQSKRTQEKLQLSELHLKNLVGAQTNYVVRIDFKGSFTYCNDKFLEDFKWFYGGEKLDGREMFKTIYAKYYNRLFDLAEHCINHPHTVAEIKLEMPKQNGGSKVVLWHVVCLTDDKGLPSEMQCTGFEVTKRQVSKNKTLIIAHKETYINLVRKTATCDWSFVSNEVNWGEGFMNLFGYNLPAGKYSIVFWAMKVHPDDWDRVRTNLKEALKDGNQYSWTINYQFKKSDGSYLLIQENAYILRNKAGEVTRIISSLSDDTKSA